jgi:hypothetical protein
MSVLSIALSLALATVAAPSPAPVPQDEPASTEVPAAAEAADTADSPIPEKIPSPPSEETGPTVTIRSSENGDVIEEYREGGRIFMVKITPTRGVPYYLYDDDRNGRMDRTDADKASVSPVYWTVYEWD